MDDLLVSCASVVPKMGNNTEQWLRCEEHLRGKKNIAIRRSQIANSEQEVELRFEVGFCVLSFFAFVRLRLCHSLVLV